MTEKKIYTMAAKFLELASELFARRCCNDVSWELLDSLKLTPEEKVHLCQEYAKWNGDEFETYGFASIPDFAWMKFLAWKITAARLHGEE
jgi:hypothetical protein